MSNWKPVGETWGKRKRPRVGRGVWFAEGRVYKAPAGTDPNSASWEEIGWVPPGSQTFGPGALYDSVVFHVPDTKPPLPETFLRPGQITGQAGRWENCTPELLASGVDCAMTPRRPGPPCPYPALTFSHQHWVINDVATGSDEG